MSSPGVSLDNAIAGITRGVENARRVAMEVAKEDSSRTASSEQSISTSDSSEGSETRVGGSIDVTV